MRNNISLLPLLLTCLCHTAAKAQNAFDSSYAVATSIYQKTIGVNTHLYIGHEYIDYDHRIKGNPFFKSFYFADATIVYNGVVYNDVQMLYDILHDDVVIKSYTNLPLILVKEKVSAFNYAGHYFIYLNADSSFSSLKVAGFYDVLHDGHIKLFAKHSKQIIEKIIFEHLESSFEEKNQYYILKNDELYGVSDKHSVLAVLKDHKSELAKYIRRQKIKFGKNSEASITKVVKYYDGLTTAK